MEDSFAPYRRGLQDYAARFEGVAFEDVHEGVLDLLPDKPGLVLDVGAGSGRDAAWFAARGWDVIAVEPMPELRALGESLHAHPRLRWLDDRLPGLEHAHRLGLSFDLVWLSAVWMHLHPTHWQRAVRKLSTLLRPGGQLMISFRNGGDDGGRGFHPVDAAALERLARGFGLALVRKANPPDRSGRAGVEWTSLVFVLPDDQTGALPTLRGVILNDKKSSTYKLALLRTLLKIADQASAFASDDGERVVLPLGLVALCWLRLYKPLLSAGLPQARARKDGAVLGFVKAAYGELGALAPHDLRVGARFPGPLGKALGAALHDAASTIARMPATFITTPDGAPLFPARAVKPRSLPDPLVLDGPTLSAFGAIAVPPHLWAAMRRLAIWVEPVVVAEWSEVMRGYAEGAGSSFDASQVARLLRWQDPARDTATARAAVERLRAQGRPLHCVWSGQRLGERFDVDHALPWAAWECSDLWNLLPASPRVNNAKRDRLVTAEALARSRERVQEFWAAAYLEEQAPLLRERFLIEANGTLAVPIVEQPAAAVLDETFAGLDVQRLRLKHDQQIQEWAPG